MVEETGSLRLQLVALREDGASTAIAEIPGALRIHLIFRARRPRSELLRTFALRLGPAGDRGTGMSEP